MLKLINSNQQNFLSKLEFILDKRKSKDPNIDAKISFIIQDVKKNKDLALIKYEKKYSKFKSISSNSIKLTKKEENKIYRLSL
jgi:histidinol dehydrogenase